MKSRILPALLLAAPLVAANPQLLGPFGGSAASVSMDPYRRGTVLASTSNALIFRSTDGGDSWARVPFPAELRARLHAFVVVPQTGVYLAGLADDTHTHSGVLRSTDGGRSWTRLTGLGPKEVWSIAVWPLNPQVIAAGAADGVFLSRDGGERWARISPESNRALRPVVSLAFDTTDSRIIYAGTPHLPWRTSDGGETWASVHDGMLDDSDVFSIHVDETRPLRVFAAACSGMYHSTNQGHTWKKLIGADGASSRTYKIAQDAVQPEIMFAGTARGLAKSTDRGMTWRLLSAHATRSIAFDPDRPGRIYVATDDAGLFRSDDHGETLVPINEGFSNRRVLSLAASGDALWASSGASAAGSTIYRRTHSGERWDNLELNSSQVLKIVPVDATRLYALTPGSLLRSIDGGQTWDVLGAPPANSRLTALVVPTVEPHRLVVSTEEEGIFFTDDDAKTWLPARTPEGQSRIKSLVTLAPRSLAAVTPTALLVSSDGVDFDAIPLPHPGSAIHGLVATRSGLMAATSRGLMRSDSYGKNWRRVPGALDGSTVSAICKHPTGRGVLFASHYGRIYGSVDDGLTWTPITPGGKLQSVEELVATEAAPGVIFAATRSQGVYLVRVEATLREAQNRERPQFWQPFSPFVEPVIQRNFTPHRGRYDTVADAPILDQRAPEHSRNSRRGRPLNAKSAPDLKTIVRRP